MKLNLSVRVFDVSFLLCIFVVAFLVAKFPSQVQADQGFILNAWSAGHFPTFDMGISSNLIAGIVRRLCPASISAEVLNCWVREIAMLIYCIPAYLLARFTLKSGMALGLFVILLFSSRMPFLWLSTELFAGGFLCLSFYAILREWPAPVTAFTIALLGLSKPDIALVALCLVAYLFLSKDSPYRRNALIVGSFFVFLGGLVLPGYLLHGASGSAERGFTSFGQHYAALFARHQLQQPPPSPWLEWPLYVGAVFHGAQSVGSVIWNQPETYLDFIALSALACLKAFVRLFKLLVLVPFFRFKIRIQSSFLEKLIWVSLIGVVPWILLSATHVRYLARYYSPILICMIAFSFGVIENGSARKVLRWLPAGVLVLSVLIQLGVAAKFFIGLHQGGIPMWWFPD